MFLSRHMRVFVCQELLEQLLLAPFDQHEPVSVVRCLSLLPITKADIEGILLKHWLAMDPRVLSGCLEYLNDLDGFWKRMDDTLQLACTVRASNYSIMLRLPCFVPFADKLS